MEMFHRYRGFGGEVEMQKKRKSVLKLREGKGVDVDKLKASYVSRTMVSWLMVTRRCTGPEIDYRLVMGKKKLREFMEWAQESFEGEGCFQESINDSLKNERVIGWTRNGEG
jgi:hypothetical protein